MDPLPSKVQSFPTQKESREVIPTELNTSQVDGWNDTTTGVTETTSDRSVSPIRVNQGPKWFSIREDENQPPLRLTWTQRYGGSALSGLIVILATLSPILMIAGHKFGFPSSRPISTIRECGTECHALLLTLTVKMAALVGAIWTIFWKSPSSTMPRIFFFRAIILLLAFLVSFTFWLFYWVRAEQDLSMLGAVAFAGGLADALLAIHYLGVLLIEIRHLSPQFQISVLRSPDGVERKYVIGELSIQRTAVWVLQRYYSEFPAYNPHMDRLPPIRKRNIQGEDTTRTSSFKFYDFDGLSSTFSPVGRLSSRGTSHNERFYEEHEFERRVRKRKARLLAAAEESFTHIKRIQDEKGPVVGMESMETAAAVFPSLARPLQKYLRVTRQQPWHSGESVLEHLATCLRLGLSSRAFLEKFISAPSVLQTCREETCSWSLVSDLSVSGTIQKNSEFLLRGGEVSLLITVSEMPHFNMSEEIVDPKNNKFSLRLSSETSV